MRLLYLGALSLLLSLGSCKKCIECKYTENGVDYSSGPVCGNKSEVEQFESDFKAAGNDIGVTSSCTNL